jgi:hypothetical protein
MLMNVLMVAMTVMQMQNALTQLEVMNANVEQGTPEMVRSVKMYMNVLNPNITVT